MICFLLSFYISCYSFLLRIPVRVLLYTSIGTKPIQGVNSKNSMCLSLEASPRQLQSETVDKRVLCKQQLVRRCTGADYSFRVAQLCAVTDSSFLLSLVRRPRVRTHSKSLQDNCHVYMTLVSSTTMSSSIIVSSAFVLYGHIRLSELLFTIPRLYSSVLSPTQLAAIHGSSLLHRKIFNNYD